MSPREDDILDAIIETVHERVLDSLSQYPFLRIIDHDTERVKKRPWVDVNPNIGLLRFGPRAFCTPQCSYIIKVLKTHVEIIHMSARPGLSALTEDIHRIEYADTDLFVKLDKYVHQAVAELGVSRLPQQVS